jgi:hypothetical protein
MYVDYNLTVKARSRNGIAVKIKIYKLFAPMELFLSGLGVKKGSRFKI